MRKKLIKNFCMAMALTMVFCGSVITVHATEEGELKSEEWTVEAGSGTCGENATWTLDEEGTLTISGTGAMQDYGDSGSAPWNCWDVKKVVISEGISSIGDYAFANCYILASVQIPDGVTSIGENAFYSCQKVQEIVLPQSVTEIKKEAFSMCFSLKKINIPNKAYSYKNNIFCGCDQLVSVGEIGSGCSVEMEFDENIPDLFLSNSVFKEVYIPEGVKTIGKNAFSSGNLEKVSIPYGVTLIDEYAFSGINLSEINLPESIETINAYAFYETKSLKDIKIPSKVKAISAYTFYDSGIISIDLSNVETIDWCAFANCKSLTEVTIPETIIEIAASSFENCTSLKTVNLPAKLNSKASQYTKYFGPFRGCSALVKLVIPEGVTGVYNLDGCSSLKELVLCDSVASVEGLIDCTSLEKLDLPNSVNRIGDIINCTSLKSINMKEGIEQVGVFDGCTNLADFELPSSVKRFGGIKNNSKLTEYVIPDGIEYIGSFAGCSNLKTITIPKSVFEFGMYYFNGNQYTDPKGNTIVPNEVIPLNTEIRCYAGSVAEKYAKDFGYQYVLIDEKNDSDESDNKTDDKTSEDNSDNTTSDTTPSTDKKGEIFASNAGNTFTKDENGAVRCYDEATGEPVINDFKCDGTYTYYFQADGTAMQDRLTYHPDGEHVIYFDSNGHEVFSNFANVKKTIAGETVDDYCFFDVHGYLYVDVVTYDQAGKELYYANPYGVLERGKWFQFSESVKCADGNPWPGAAGNYGYANADGTLMVNQYTYDWEGRYCYLQGNGAAKYD